MFNIIQDILYLYVSWNIKSDAVSSSVSMGLINFLSYGYFLSSNFDSRKCFREWVYSFIVQEADLYVTANAHIDLGDGIGEFVVFDIA